MEEMIPQEQLFRVAQLPIIEERLRGLKDQIENTVNEAMSLVCTEETLQTVKAKRAELRKLYDELETQRKAVKAAVMGPYDDFEDVYRKCVTEPMKRGDADLKWKIDDTENGIKSHCETELREYFDELCAANGLDWLEFEMSGVKVDMASAKQKTPKKLREQLVQFVTGVARDVDALDGMEHADELLAAYKGCLDVATAISIVEDRHRQIKAEEEARKARAAQKAAEAEAVRKVEALAPPTVKVEPEEQIFPEFQFWVFGETKKRLVAIREWLKANHYNYK